MACFFCDSTPMTKDAVEHLAAIRLVLEARADTTPEMLLELVTNNKLAVYNLKYELNQEQHMSSQLRWQIAERDSQIHALHEKIRQLNEAMPPRIDMSPFGSSPLRTGENPWYASGTESWRHSRGRRK